MFFISINFEKYVKENMGYHELIQAKKIIDEKLKEYEVNQTDNTLGGQG